MLSEKKIFLPSSQYEVQHALRYYFICRKAKYEAH